MMKNKLMAWNDHLTGPALSIAASTSTRLLVMAGPGTGKSFAMKRRILKLIEEDHVEPEKILALTFTRTIAQDLKKDLHDLGIEKATSINAMTLHAFCFSLLNQRKVFDVLGRVPRPIKSFTSKGSPQFELSPLMADLDLINGFGNKREKFRKLKAFEAAWARMQNDTPHNIDQKDIKFKNVLIDWLKDHRAILLGELIPLALEYLSNNPADEIFNKFSYIVVDEYQDLNKAEQILIDRLGKNCKISVVGDVDQSIYSFRYAHPDGIIDFENRHQHQCEKFTIESCRRCGKNIISAANSLILHNHQDGFDRLKPLAENMDGKVRSVQWNTFEDEVSGITEFIKSLLEKNHFKLSDILILSPRRLLAYRLKENLLENSLNVHSFFHEEAIEKSFAQESVTLLNLKINPDDSVALRFWLGFGSQSWQAKQYKTLLDTAKNQGVSVKNLLDGILADQFNVKGISHIKQAYQRLLNRLEILKDKSTKELVDELFPEGNDDTKILREACLLLLANEENASIEDVWKHIETMITHPETPEHGNYIRIMSLHKSKGLTSRITIIANCIEGLIPRREKNEQMVNNLLEEQRRLFYVAMTRAKECLVISSFAKIDRKIAYEIGAKVSNNSNLRGEANTIGSQFITEAKLATLTGTQWRESNFN